MIFKVFHIYKYNSFIITPRKKSNVLKEKLFGHYSAFCVSIGNLSTSYVRTERLLFYGNSKRRIDFLHVSYLKYYFFMRRFDLIVKVNKNGRVSYVFLS